MFLAAESYGWMEWWGFWFGLGGLVLAVLGFIMGWLQIRKVRAAAEAARAASEKAVLRVSDRIALEELSELRDQLGLLTDAVHHKRREAATVFCYSCRRRLSALQFREGFALPTEDRELLDTSVRALTGLEGSLRTADPSQPWDGVTKKVRADLIRLDSKVAEWTARTRTQQTLEPSS